MQSTHRSPVLSDEPVRDQGLAAGVAVNRHTFEENKASAKWRLLLHIFELWSKLRKREVSFFHILHECMGHLVNWDLGDRYQYIKTPEIVRSQFDVPVWQAFFCCGQVGFHILELTLISMPTDWTAATAASSSTISASVRRYMCFSVPTYSELTQASGPVMMVPCKAEPCLSRQIKHSFSAADHKSNKRSKTQCCAELWPRCSNVCHYLIVIVKCYRLLN